MRHRSGRLDRAGEVRQQFTAAFDSLVARIRQDRSILAAVLCGSLSHDRVWSKSDIDLVLVTVDDRKIKGSHVALYADGVNVHAILIPRTEFRRTVEGSVHNSFVHSFLAKGRLVYTHDPSIGDLCARLSAIGQRDAAMQRFAAAMEAVLPFYKARKWFLTRRDLDYTALWILYTATPLARIEVIDAGQLVDREVIPQAIAINPKLFNTIYRNLLNKPKTDARVKAALDAVDRYLSTRARELFAPAVDYLREAGEIRSCTEIENHFTRNFGLEGVTTACEYLADAGLIGKAGAGVRLTERSTADVQELAFFTFDDAPDEF